MTSPLDLMTSASLSTVHSHTFIVTSINKKYKKLRYNKMWWNKLFRLHSSVKETHRKRPVGPLLKKNGKQNTKQRRSVEELLSLFTVLLALWDITFLLPLAKTDPGKQAPRHSTMESMPCQVHSCKTLLQGERGTEALYCVSVRRGFSSGKAELTQFILDVCSFFITT